MSSPAPANATASKTASTSTSASAKLIELVNTQIASVVQGLTSSVTQVSSAFSMQLNEIADAYSGRCPDQSSDVDPLDLDTNYVTLLDNLRRSRPRAFNLLADVARWWHENPIPLVDQAAKMATHSSTLVARLNTVQSSCTSAVVEAVAALLSTALPPAATSEAAAAEAAAAEASASAAASGD